MVVKWSEMTPRERDALVAEKVMGYKFVRFADVIVRYTGEDYFADNAERKVFSPSTDIAAAWEVVEKMVAEGWEPSIEYSSHGYPWTVWMGHDALDAGVGHGDTVPSAICLSALRAVGVDI